MPKLEDFERSVVLAVSRNVSPDVPLGALPSGVDASGGLEEPEKESELSESELLVDGIINGSCSVRHR